MMTRSDYPVDDLNAGDLVDNGIDDGNDFDDFYDDRPPPKVPHNLLPWEYGDWRDIPESTMVRLGAGVWTHRTWAENDDGTWIRTGDALRVYFPFFQHGDWCGGTGRLVEDVKATGPLSARASETPEQVSARHEEWWEDQRRTKWKTVTGTRTGRILYNYDNIAEGSVVVLTEGVSSALPCIEASIPTLAVLGSANFNRTKRDLLLALKPKLVVVALDGDDAGHLGTKRISAGLQGHVPVKIVELPPGKDPMSMGREWIQGLKAAVDAEAGR